MEQAVWRTLEINFQLTTRIALRQSHRKQGEIWLTNFHSAIMDAMNVERISSDKEVHQAFPAAILQAFGPPVVCWKYAEPAGMSICNEKHTVMNAHRICHQRCACHEINDQYKDASGCVVTSNLGIVEHEDTRQRMKSGTTFRDAYLWMQYEQARGKPPRPEELLALDASLTEYISRCAKTHEVPPHMFNEWRSLLMLKLTDRYEEVKATVTSDAEQQQDTQKGIKEYLKQFQKRYAIITGDKAKNTYCIVCKPWLCKQIMKETQET